MVVPHFTLVLLCFRQLSKSLFLLGALLRRSKFANVRHDLMQNYLSSPLTKSFILFAVFFLFKKKLSLFPIVKKNAIHAGLCRIGNLEADFQQVPLVQLF